MGETLPFLQERVAPPRLQMALGSWYFADGVLRCVGEVAIERLMVNGHDLVAEIAESQRHARRADERIGRKHYQGRFGRLAQQRHGSRSDPDAIEGGGRAGARVAARETDAAKRDCESDAGQAQHDARAPAKTAKARSGRAGGGGLAALRGKPYNNAAALTAEEEAELLEPVAVACLPWLTPVAAATSRDVLLRIQRELFGGKRGFMSVARFG